MTLRETIEQWLRESPDWLEQPFAPSYMRWRDLRAAEDTVEVQKTLPTDLAAVRQCAYEGMTR